MPVTGIGSAAAADPVAALVTALTAVASASLQKSSNLSDLTNPSTALTNLGAVLNAQATQWPGVGREVHVSNRSAFLVRGCNLGFGPGSGVASASATWNTWDWANFLQPVIDDVANWGFNTLRIIGSYDAYAADPTGYKVKFVQVLEYARTKHLKVIYAFLHYADGGGETIAAASLSLYQAMVTDLMTAYVGDALILGWDAGNEMKPGTVSGQPTVISGMASTIRTLDPAAKVGCSYSGVSQADVQAADPYVDWHDVHLYINPSRANFSGNWLDEIRYVTSKPLLVGEFGANVNASGSVGPFLTDENSQAQYVRAMRKYAAGGQLMGFCHWKPRDAANNEQFGLRTSAGAVRQQVAELLKYPDVRLDAARDYTDYRWTPILLDSGARADSSSSAGTPPIGPAWTAARGTWGISNKRLYVGTSDGSLRNILVADVNTCDPLIECEFEPATTAKVGIVFRYVDTSNYFVYEWDSTVPGVRLRAVSSGSETDQTPDAAYGGAGGVALTAKFPIYGRLKLICRGTDVYLYVFDRLVGIKTLASNSTVTKHGISRGIASADGGTKFTNVSIQMPLRYY